MTNLPAKIRTHILKLQKNRISFYLIAAERFKSNHLIHDKYVGLARNLETHTAALEMLQTSWKRLQESQAKTVLEALNSALSAIPGRVPEETPLRQYLAWTLDLEEPAIMGIYAPIFRLLKANWTDRSMDVYVMVRSHLARLQQLIEPYCGDPTLSRRCGLLAQNLEHELQRSLAADRQSAGEVRSKARLAAKDPDCREHVAGRHHKARKPLKPARMAANRAERLAKRTKPLVRNIKMARRRARA